MAGEERPKDPKARKFINEAIGTEFPEKPRDADIEYEEERRMLTGEIAEVEEFIDELQEELPWVGELAIIQMQDLGVTGQSILVLKELVRGSLEDFTELIAAVWHSSRERKPVITPAQLIEGLDRAQRGLSHGLDIAKAIKQFRDYRP